MINQNGVGSPGEDEKRTKGYVFFRRFPILSSILMMVILSIIIVFVFLFLASRYTRHGENVVLPNVIGLPLETAMSLLESNKLSCEVVDSMYTLGRTPGTVIDVVPSEGAKIKPHRTVFLKVVAFGKPQQSIPEVSNMSMRQARATLEGLGFTRIEVRYVPGEFDNLTQALATSSGKKLSPGERVSIDTPITILVSSNNIDLPSSNTLDSEWDKFLSDSLAVDSVPKAKKQEKKEEPVEPMDENERWW